LPASSIAPVHATPITLMAPSSWGSALVISPYSFMLGPSADCRCSGDAFIARTASLALWCGERRRRPHRPGSNDLLAWTFGKDRSARRAPMED
jgi:hypothetical protein